MLGVTLRITITDEGSYGKSLEVIVSDGRGFGAGVGKGK